MCIRRMSNGCLLQKQMAKADVILHVIYSTFPVREVQVFW